MRIVIIGSLKNEEQIKEAEAFFKSTFTANVVTPFEYNNDNSQLSLVNIQRLYFRQIQEADLVVAVVKDQDYEPVNGTKKEWITFEASTCCELAVARELGKKVVYWAQ